MSAFLFGRSKNADLVTNPGDDGGLYPVGAQVSQGDSMVEVSAINSG